MALVGLEDHQNPSGKQPQTQTGGAKSDGFIELCNAALDTHHLARVMGAMLKTGEV